MCADGNFFGYDVPVIIVRLNKTDIVPDFRADGDKVHLPENVCEYLCFLGVHGGDFLGVVWVHGSFDRVYGEYVGPDRAGAGHLKNVVVV